MRGLSEFVLDGRGRRKYRVIGLVDNDPAGRRAIDQARGLDSSVREYRDLFRIRPTMPTTGNLDPATLNRTFGRLNAECQRLDWELEDLLSVEFVDSFIDDHPGSLIRRDETAGKVHWKLTPTGKERLHAYVWTHAIDEDLRAVCSTLRSVRFLLNLVPFGPRSR